MPRASIVIPTFNRAPLLPGAVWSAWSAARDVEVIVVDDGSSDDTPDVCRRLTNITYVRLAQNVGLAGARNTGIRGSVSDYIVVLDDDDALFPNAVDEAIETLERQPQAGFSYGRVLVQGRDGAASNLWPERCPSGDLFWEFLSGFCPCPHSFVIRRGPLFASGLFNDALRHFEDWDLWTRLSHDYLGIAVEHPMGLYRPARADSGQITSNFAVRARKGLAVQARNLELPRARSGTSRERREVRGRFRNHVADFLVFSASEALRDGALSQSRRNLLLALRLHPLRSFRPWTLRLLLASAARIQYGAWGPVSRRSGSGSS